MVLTAHAAPRVDDSPARGIHLAWSPDRSVGYSVDGYSIWRRRHVPSREQSCHELDEKALGILHERFELDTPLATVSLRLGEKPKLVDGELPDEPFRGRVGGDLREISSLDRIGQGEERRRTSPTENLLGRDALLANTALSAVRTDPEPLGTTARRIARPPRCVVYDVRFDHTCRGPTLEVGPRVFMAFAYLANKVVATKLETDASAASTVDFGAVSIDRIVVYVPRPLSRLRICCPPHDVLDAFDLNDASEWKNIARGVQLPFAGFDSSLTPIQERARAESRLLPGEQLGNGDFDSLSGIMNAAASFVDRASVAHMTKLEGDSSAGEAVAVSPFELGTAMAADPMWRRALGFAWVDGDDELVEGEAYDYIILGHARARDAIENVLGFHTVPIDTKLPQQFRLQNQLISTDAPLVVSRPANSGGDAEVFRKGLRIAGAIGIVFSAPTDRVVLDFETTEELDLRYEGRAEHWSLVGPFGESGILPARRRVELTFAQPIEELRLEGVGFFYGLRTNPVPDGADPDARVANWTLLEGVRFTESPPPAQPLFLGATSLQAPVTSGTLDATPPSDLGFRLHWLPPAQPNAVSPWLWPSDLDGSPPFDVSGFELERARIDDGSDFTPVTDEAGNPVRLMGNRQGTRTSPEALGTGGDVLAAYPETTAPRAPVSIFMRFEDLLTSVSRPNGPPPGSLHRYRVRSFDLTGRFSEFRESSVVRLEKRIPPPLPVGAPRADESRIEPIGVHARVLQAEDPLLTDQERTLLGDATNAIVLSWGWTERERTRDPYASEFRIYFDPEPPDRISGRLSESISLVGNTLEAQATLSHAVELNQFVGHRIRGGDFTFRIVGHDAGSQPIVRLALNDRDPDARPGDARFTLTPIFDGREARAATWPERLQVVPLAAESSYQVVLRDRVSVDATNPRARVWLGVSAADDQAYVLDERSSGELANRPGNESSIVVAAADFRFLGRPTMPAPSPLAAIPEQLCPEVEASHVSHRLEIGALLADRGVPLPARYQLERISATEVLSLVSPQTNNELRVAFPASQSGPVLPATYAPDAPIDRSLLLDQVRDGIAARIENRFILDLLEKLGLDERMQPLWAQVDSELLSGPIAADRVPNEPDRFIYRVRAADTAGRISDESVVLPAAFRVPSSRRPGAPEILSSELDGAEAHIRVSARDEFDAAGLLWFGRIRVLDPEDSPGASTPEIVRVRNRAESPMHEGIWLREPGGEFLPPTHVGRGDGTREGDQRHYDLRVPLGAQQELAFWCVAITRDHRPSVPSAAAIVIRQVEG